MPATYWYCDNCRSANQTHSDRCYACGGPRPAVPTGQGMAPGGPPPPVAPAPMPAAVPGWPTGQRTASDPPTASSPTKGAGIGAGSAFALLVALVAAGLLVVAGGSLDRAAGYMDIHSIGGQTIDEAFYQAFGMFTKALSIVCYGLAAMAIVVGIPRRR